MARDLDRRSFLKLAGGGAIALGGGLTLFRPRRAGAAEPKRQAEAIARIGGIASASAIASYRWLNRGRAPAGYVKGMAVSYAKLHVRLAAGDAYASEMAKGLAADGAKDALKHYEDKFREAGLGEAKPGAETLRRLFVLMLGLGMRESSGRYCEGRDRSADNTTAETAEAGLFQTSFNARRASPLMSKLFQDFLAKPEPSYLDVFKEGVRPKEDELENYGTGDGQAFQKISKECPFFAVQFAAIGLRNVRKHWGPINRHAAEVKVESDAMFAEVEKLVEQDKLGPAL